MPFLAYSRIQQLLILATAVTAVSSASVIAILSGVPGSAASFWRMIISALLLTPLAVKPSYNENYPSTLTLNSILVGMAAGLMLGIHMSSWLESLAYASVAVSTTIVCTHALFSSVFSIGIGEPPRKPQIIGIVISLVGVFLLTGADPSSSVLGGILALIGAVSGGAYFVLGRVSRNKLSLKLYLPITYATAAFVSLLFSYIQGEPLTGYTLESWGYLLLLALIPNVIGHSLLNLSLRFSTATTVTGAVLGEPVGATVLAFILLGQHPPVTVYLYMGIVLLGVALSVKSGLEL
ncbi:MAG: DMT family transporter [Desulfurococcales archaeon]|nr:DMT family transporter [Desulfurococcales archaeon]